MFFSWSLWEIFLCLFIHELLQVNRIASTIVICQGLWFIYFIKGPASGNNINIFIDMIFCLVKYEVYATLIFFLSRIRHLS